MTSVGCAGPCLCSNHVGRTRTTMPSLSFTSGAFYHILAVLSRQHTAALPSNQHLYERHYMITMASQICSLSPPPPHTHTHIHPPTPTPTHPTTTPHTPTHPHTHTHTTRAIALSLCVRGVQVPLREGPGESAAVNVSWTRTTSGGSPAVEVTITPPAGGPSVYVKGWPGKGDEYFEITSTATATTTDFV
jgi:hypothetical protein